MDFESLWASLASLPSLAAGESLEETHRPEWQADAGAPPPRFDDVGGVPTIGSGLSLSPPPTGDEVLVVGPVERDLVVVGELGRGGMGTVLLARQSALGREVAVKVPNPGAHACTINALAREARITGGLEHPGIVPVHALAFDDGGRPALVMKRIEGVSWATLAKEPRHPAWAFVAGHDGDRLEAQVQLAVQVCNAVAFAHRQGVLHRDIKPANIMVGEFGVVYLGDWGVALRRSPPTPPRPPALVGTPLYFAPEMVTGDDAEMDERTDIYLLGATLYHVLSGAPPHPGHTLRDVLEHAWTQAPAPLPPQVPEDLARVVMRAMAFEKSDRFASAVELKDALTGFLRNRGSHRLAAATMTRLEALEAELSTVEPSRERFAPLLSACRFGFMQALAEWPESATAREGLERTVRAAAWFEVKARNADAARALVRELKKPPSDLLGALRELELGDELSAVRRQRIDRLQRELDPRVAMRQRRNFFLVVALAAMLASLVPSLAGLWGPIEGAVGHYLLLVKLVPATLAFVVGIVIGRKSLLGTRLNRRIVAMLALAIGALLLNRATCAVLGLPHEVTLVIDLVMLSVVALAAALSFHWGFAIGAGAMLVGAVVTAQFPAFAQFIFSLSAAVGLTSVFVTWTSWRSEWGTG